MFKRVDTCLLLLLFDPVSMPRLQARRQGYTASPELRGPGSKGGPEGPGGSPIGARGWGEKGKKKERKKERKKEKKRERKKERK